MKKQILCLSIAAFAALFACALPAAAQTSRLYFAGYIGLTQYNEGNFSEGTTSTDGQMEFRNAISLAGAMGLRLTPQWRVEAEVSRRSGDIASVDFKNGGTYNFGGDITSMLYMLNLYYDIDWQWKNFQPFVNAGIGLATHEVQLEDTSGLLPNATDDTMLGFAWSLGGGLKYRMTPNLAMTGNYRFVGTSDIEADSYDIDWGAHEIRFGMEYDLPLDWFR